LTDADQKYHPFLIDYPVQQMRDKIHYMTDLLEDRFRVKMLSHRAGRWSFNEAYAKLLIERGYRVDCSVTPHVSWASVLGAPGHYGSDYTFFPENPYFVDVNDISRSGASPLLEVPFSVCQSWLRRKVPSLYSGSFGRIARRIAPETSWLRPRDGNLKEMLDVMEWADSSGRDHLEFMLHSSEFMPGGSPNFSDASAIDRLYDALDELFFRISKTFVGSTLSEYRDSLELRIIQNP
jgi:hypothetical protein